MPSFDLLRSRLLSLEREVLLLEPELRPHLKPATGAFMHLFIFRVLALLWMGASPAFAQEASDCLSLPLTLEAAGYHQLARDELLHNCLGPDVKTPSPRSWQAALDQVQIAGGRWLLVTPALREDPSRFSLDVHFQIRYLQAINSYDAGDYEHAFNIVSEIPTYVSDGGRAAFIKFNLARREEKYRTAVASINGVQHAWLKKGRLINRKADAPYFDPVSRRYRQQVLLANQAVLNYGYLLFSLGLYQEAEHKFSYLLRHSLLLPEAVLAQGWTHYWQGRNGRSEVRWLNHYDRLLGTQLSPEFLYLKALVGFINGRPVAPEAVRFEAVNAPIARSLKALATDPSALGPFREAVRSYATTGKVTAPWSGWVLRRFSSDRDLMDADHVALAVQEERLLQDPRFSPLIKDLNHDAPDRVRLLILRRASLLLENLHTWGAAMTELWEAEAREQLLAP